jgi:hypothetical protein
VTIARAIAHVYRISQRPLLIVESEAFDPPQVAVESLQLEALEIVEPLQHCDLHELACKDHSLARLSISEAPGIRTRFIRLSASSRGDVGFCNIRCWLRDVHRCSVGWPILLRIQAPRSGALGLQYRSFEGHVRLLLELSTQGRLRIWFSDERLRFEWER